MGVRAVVYEVDFEDFGVARVDLEEQTVSFKLDASKDPPPDCIEYCKKKRMRDASQKEGLPDDLAALFNKLSADDSEVVPFMKHGQCHCKPKTDKDADDVKPE